MSRTSLLLGVVVAIVVHAALFWPFSAKVPSTRKPLPPRLTVEQPPEEKPEEPEPQTEPESKPEPKEEPELARREEAPPSEPEPVEPVEPEVRKAVAPPPAPMEEIADTRRTDIETPAVGDALSEGPDDDALPPVRIVWDGPGEVRSVARELGIRIVAVDRSGDVLGEVSRTGATAIVPFESGTSRFSNRVRMIDDRDFFGEEIPKELNGRLSAFWLLVPSDLDRALSNEIRRTIRDSGYSASDVRFVEATFEERAGRRVLKIGRIETGAGL